jgi:acetyl esterase
MSRYDYSRVEQNTRAFLEGLQKNSGPPIYKLSPEQARNVLSSVQAAPIEKLDADIENRSIPGGLTGELSVQIVRPPDSHNTILPVVVYFHGGGWVLGGSDTHDRWKRELANGAQVAIVFVNYTPSPEAKYPVPLEQAYAAAKWVAENGQTINVDPTRLAVAGDSVGGNMAIAVTLLAKERGGPKIKFQVLFYPVTDANFDTPSYMEY